MAGFNGDLAEAGDEEFAGDDESGGPEGADAFGGQKDEGGADEDFIGEGVEEFTKGGDEVHFAGEPAVKEVAGGGDDEEDESGEMAPC